MKKIFGFVLIAIMCMSLAACGEDATTQGSASTPEVTPPDLTGEWMQVNSNSEDSWQSATIDENTITVYWVSDNGDTKSLYWAGTYTAPETADEPYTWNSENDTEQTSTALLASGDDIKTFTYEEISINSQKNPNRLSRIFSLTNNKKSCSVF